MKRHPAALALTDGDDTIILRPENPGSGDPIFCRSWDLGAPEVREVVTASAAADGAIDTTQFAGSRTVTFELWIQGDAAATAYEYANRLAAMAHPSRRPVLRISRTDDPPAALAGDWILTLRGNPWSVTYGRTAGAYLEMQLTFTAPLGLLETEQYRTLSTQAIAAGPSTGMHFPLFFPLNSGSKYGANPPIDFTVLGSAPVQPFLYITGPVTDPEVRTDEGQRFAFTNLTVASGEMVAIDMAAGTARRDGQPDQSIYNLIDFTVSTFWTWRPGRHIVRYYAPSGQLTIQWRDRRVTL